VSDAPTRISERAAELRSAFDHGFAQPIHFETMVQHDLLAIRVGAEACAIRLTEIAGLLVDKKITRVPGSDAALLGIAGLRGAIMPVFSLQSLMGHPAAAKPRWLVIAAGAPVALAFDAFEGRMRVSPDAILPRPSGMQTRSYAREFVRTPAQARSVIHLPSILGAIKMQEPGAVPREER
jgi:chemotaxis signal transduction protein